MLFAGLFDNQGISGIGQGFASSDAVGWVRASAVLDPNDGNQGAGL